MAWRAAGPCRRSSAAGGCDLPSSVRCDSCRLRPGRTARVRPRVHADDPMDGSGRRRGRGSGSRGQRNPPRRGLIRPLGEAAPRGAQPNHTERVTTGHPAVAATSPEALPAPALSRSPEAPRARDRGDRRWRRVRRCHGARHVSGPQRGRAKSERRATFCATRRRPIPWMRWSWTSATSASCWTNPRARADWVPSRSPDCRARELRDGSRVSACPGRIRALVSRVARRPGTPARCPEWHVVPGTSERCPERSACTRNDEQTPAEPRTSAARRRRETQPYSRAAAGPGGAQQPRSWTIAAASSLLTLPRATRSATATMASVIA